MITFKQFLQESQNYPLFHGMSIKGFVYTIRNNILSPGMLGSDALTPELRGKETLSFTRSRNFADYWSKRKNYVMDLSYNADRRQGYPSIIIQVNREKLRNNHKIVPYNHFSTELASSNPVARRSHDKRWFNKGRYEHHQLDHNQYEERVIGEVRNIIKYIDKVHFSKDALEEIKNKPDVYDIVKDNGWI